MAAAQADSIADRGPEGPRDPELHRSRPDRIRLAARLSHRVRAMRRFLRENSLSLALLGLFLVFLAAQSLTGLRVYNADAAAHGEKPLGYVAYLGSGHFVEAIFENWESEFLQMAAYVVLTVALFRRDHRNRRSSRRRPRATPTPEECPWPVRRGGLGPQDLRELTVARPRPSLVMSIASRAGGALTSSASERCTGRDLSAGPSTRAHPILVRVVPELAE